MLTISIGDDRLQYEGNGPRDYAAIMAELSTMPNTTDGVRAFEKDFLEPSTRGSEVSRVREDYYRIIVDTTVADSACN